MSNPFDLFTTAIETPEELATRQEFEQALEAVRAQALTAPDERADLEEDRVIWCVEWPKRVERLASVLSTDIARAMRLHLPPTDVAMLHQARETFERWLHVQQEAKEREQLKREMEEAKQKAREREEREAKEREEKEAKEREEKGAREQEQVGKVSDEQEPDNHDEKEPSEHQSPEAHKSQGDPEQHDASDSDEHDHDASDIPVATKHIGISVIQIRRPQPSVVVEMPPRKRQRVVSHEPTDDGSEIEEANLVRRVGRDRCKRCIARNQTSCGCSLVTRTGKVTDGSRTKGKGKGRAIAATPNRNGPLASTSALPDIELSSSEEGDVVRPLRPRKAMPTLGPYIEVMKSEVERWKVDIAVARANHQTAIAQVKQAKLHVKSVEDAARRAQQALQKLLAEASGSG
ncbi:hypothetical protein J3R83DRAFT_10953 [Lanmaoa asiatica]|nr:hypothetical protein J3R83DRAFT_10953 [Lanmaoa asiatica]